MYIYRPENQTNVSSKRCVLTPLSRLISAKVTLLMLLSFSIGIIFLEARLYSVGSTVFGLLSVAALFIGKFEFLKLPQITKK